MAKTLQESSNTSEMTISLANKRCYHLTYFKEFLRDFTKDAVTNEGNLASSECGSVSCNGSSGNAEVRPLILTRTNNESYNVTEDELSAEIIMCIWQWLQQKLCPKHFQVGLLEMMVEEINKELKNTKIHEDLKSSSVKSSEELMGEMFDLLKLQSFISRQLDKIVLRLSDNSKEENLKHYADCFKNSLSICNEPAITNQTPFVEAHIKNKPRKMEDRHICLPSFSEMYRLEHSYSFYGVFDGHSGSLAATYASNQIPYLVAQQLKCRNKLANTDTDYYRDVLESSFLKVDFNFGQKQLGSGTTAVCALLKKDDQQNFNHLYVAWVGDSRCLLVSPTVHLQLVKPHKPDTLDERKRIESTETGGSVIFVQGQWRVNGIINVSRSIGDYTVKAVIAEPDIVDVPLQSSHDFLLLGTDGLWDHAHEEEIVDRVYKSLANEEQCLDDIPKHVIELAKQGDSQDNITIVIVLLKNRQRILNNYLKSLKKTT